MRIALAVLLLGGAGWTQVAREANRDYESKEGRQRMVQILEGPRRIANIRPGQLVARLKITPGSTVADVGTGTGILLPALSRAAGPKGRVIAEDIHQDFLDRAREQARQDSLQNVEFVLGTETDPRLPAHSADLVVLLDCYHHFDYPERMLAAIRRGMRPGARLAIIEYHKKLGAMEVSPEHALTHIRAGAEQVISELQAAGFKLLWRDEHAPGKQYIAMFGLP